jgi:hypothetical protein
VSLKSLSEAQHNFSGPAFSAASGTPFTMVSAVPGRRICVYRMIITVASATTFWLADNAAAGPFPITQQFQLGITGGVSLDVPFNFDPWWYTGQQFLNLLGGATAAQQGGVATTNAGLAQAGQGLAITGNVGTTSVMGWDIWWDAHP